VIPLSLAQIARITGGRLDGDPAAVVTGEVVIDSRRVAPGGLFAAVEGERVDGHDFAAAAVAAGAVAVLGTRPVPVPSVLVADVPDALAALARFVVDSLPAARIAGITGSSGKTTTKDIAAQLIERLGPTIAPAGSFNNEFGHPLTVLRADAATRYLVLELSARGVGHIAHLCGIAPPRYGVVLNVGRAHAGEFGGLDQVARAKGELVEALPPDGVAILNADDPRVLAMSARTSARIVTFGCTHATHTPHQSRAPQPSFLAADIRLDDLGRPSFTLLTPDGSAPVSLRLHGAHNVPNALAAAALASELGLSLGEISGGLGAAVARSRWRMEVRQRADGVTPIQCGPPSKPCGTWRGTAAGSRSSGTWPSSVTPRWPATPRWASSPPTPGLPG
jgi:UDP-N-acetylmuramoyl-tripeptide--D-alanyl-D-alanine ligase